MGLAAAGLAGAPFAAGGEPVPATKRPNVLFLFSDDQRHDTIHVLGNDVIQTPTLDALCAAGARSAKRDKGSSPTGC
jgi:hypothetical protein